MTPNQKKAYNDEYNRRNAGKIAAQRKEFRRKNKERLNGAIRAWRANSKDHVSAKNLEYRQTNPDKVKVDQKEWYENGGKITKSRTGYLRNLAVKQEFVDAYGGVCKCGENNINRLCADHVNDDGYKHRRSGLRGSTPTYKWAKKNGWPSSLQLLCHNCNAIKASEYWRSQWKNQALESNGNRHNRLLKESVIAHYSHGTGACAMCPQTDIRALQIDHLNGGGRQHISILRLNCGTPTSLYRFLRNNGFPAGYRVLCASCNMEQGILERRKTALSCPNPPGYHRANNGGGHPDPECQDRTHAP